MKLRHIIVLIVFSMILINFLPTPSPVEKNIIKDQLDLEEKIEHEELAQSKKRCERELKSFDETQSQECTTTKIIRKLQPEISDEELEEIAKLTIDSSNEYDLDPYWMLAIMYTESRFRNNVVSNEGARGLMQLIPSTAKIYGVTKEQLHIPSINIDTGFQYYRYLLDMFDDQRMATIAYNQGPGNISRGSYRTWYHERVRKIYNEILEEKEKLEEELK